MWPTGGITSGACRRRTRPALRTVRCQRSVGGGFRGFHIMTAPPTAMAVLLAGWGWLVRSDLTAQRASTNFTCSRGVALPSVSILIFPGGGHGESGEGCVWEEGRIGG